MKPNMKQKHIYSATSLLLVFTIVFAALALTGCESKKSTKAERDEVRVVMEMRQKAIQTQDIELYKQVFVPDYNNSGIRFDTLIEVMQNNFANNDTIEFKFKRSMVDMAMNSARMVGQISYQGNGMESPIYDQERTIFRRIDGQWRISGGVKVIPF